jgi:isoleucyl-tRNA synthetase
VEAIQISAKGSPVMMLDAIKPKVAFPELEHEMLALWKEHDIAQRSMNRDAPKGQYVFYEGPPTANGQPGLHIHAWF